jgi:hypothetical protein
MGEDWRSDPERWLEPFMAARDATASPLRRRHFSEADQSRKAANRILAFRARPADQNS